VGLILRSDELRGQMAGSTGELRVESVRWDRRPFVTPELLPAKAIAAIVSISGDSAFSGTIGYPVAILDVRDR
jgi:hypothetical protein